MSDKDEEKLVQASYAGPLKNPEQLLRYQAMIIDQIHESVVSTDLNGIVTSWNKGAEKQFGYTSQEMLGQHISTIYPPENHELLMNDIIAPLQAKGIHEIDTTIRRKSGEDFIAHLSLFMVYDELDKPIGMIGYTIDISDRILAEESHRKNKAHLRALIETLPDLVWLKDPEGVYLTCNHRFELLVDIKESELIGKTDYDVFDKGLADFFREKDKAAIAAGKPCTNEEELTYASDGHVELVETIKTPMFDSKGEIVGVLGIARDITERVRATTALRKSQEELDRIFNISPDMIGYGTLDGHFTKINSSLYSILGYTEEEFLNKSFLEFIHPDDVAATGAILQKAAEGLPSLEINNRYQCKDGEYKWIGWSVVCDVSKNEFLAVGRDVTVSVEAEIELNKHRNHLEELIKERTSELVNARLEAESANRAKSDFLSKMSHELRTPLNAILGFGQLLSLEADGFTDTQQSNIEEILNAGHHLLDLINDMLDLAKIEAGKISFKLEDISLNELIESCVILIQSQAEARNLELINKVSNKSHFVLADSTRLKQVLLNILSNAVKYNREHGRITINSELVEKQRLRISVTDTGKGLTEDEISKLFIPFERLNVSSNIEGTGIGLVITKHLIEIMGGVMGVDSIPGEGSTFWFELELLHSV